MIRGLTGHWFFLLLLVFLDFLAFLRSVRRRPPAIGIGGFEFEFDGGGTVTIGFKPFLDSVFELFAPFSLVELVEVVELVELFEFPICLYFNA